MNYARSLIAARTLRACAVLALVLGATFVMRATLASAAGAGKAVDVDITKFAYGPKEITIAPGTKVVWINHDETPHTVTADDKAFASKGLDTDDKFEHTFSKEGDFGYLCTVHPFMTGIVHVRKP